MSDSPASLARLRRRVARIAGARGAAGADLFTTGHREIDRWLGGGLARGRLHEMLCDHAEDAGALTGFVAMLALRAVGDATLLWLRTEAAEKRCGRLHATGLAGIGLAGDALLLAVLPDDDALLRAAGDAARCAGLGALVVEAWGDPKPLDLTATRRLMLAAEQSGVTVLLARAAARESPSVADTRWAIAAAASTALPANAPGHPVFDIVLLRRRAGPAGRQWRVEWNRERKAFQEPAGDAALPGAVLPLAAG